MSFNAPTKRKLTPEAYTVAWFCVLPHELIAGRAMLDEQHERLETSADDNNIYCLGQIGEHNIAIVQAPGQGSAGSANVTTHLLRSFPHIRFALIVGIGGGATTAPHCGMIEDIRLGDVIVSRPESGHAGILQYDHGVETESGFQSRSVLNIPAQILVAASGQLECDHAFDQPKMEVFIKETIQRLQVRGIRQFAFPGRDSGRLFYPDYTHPQGPPSCEGCDPTREILRAPRAQPRVHYGLIASGNRVVRNATFRDKMRQRYNVLCFEMEAPGLVNYVPSLSIRGVSDYADSHKNDQWQPYAAITAAAYAKDLLSIIPAQKVESTSLASEIARLIPVAKQMKDQWAQENRYRLLNWLSPLNFHKRHQELLDSSVPTGNWLLQSQAFKRWSKGARWALQCYGQVGTGKTYMCAIIADHLQQTFEGRPVIYLYLKDGEASSQTTERILGAILKEMIQFSGSDIPKSLVDQYNQDRPNDPPATRTMKNTLEELLRKCDRTYVIIDGLTHCDKKVQKAVVPYLITLITKDTNLSLLTTSWDYRETANVIKCDSCHRSDVSMRFTCTCDGKNYDVCWRCRDAGKACPNGHEGLEIYSDVEVEIHSRDPDLEAYCRRRLSQATETPEITVDERLEAKDLYVTSESARYLIDKPELKGQIAQTVSRKAQGNFLLAKCWMDDLLPTGKLEGSHQDLIDKLESIPSNSFGKYVNEKLEDLHRYGSNTEHEVALDTLRYILAACRPLTLPALQHALALNSGTGLIPDQGFDTRDSIVKACRGFITIDKGDQTVHFFHGSIRKLMAIIDHVHFKEIHSRMALTCLYYLSHPQVSHHYANLETYPFLQYALKHWGDHVREACKIKYDDKAREEAFRFLQNRNHIQAFAQALGVADPKIIPWIHESIGKLHICAWFGLSALIKRFVYEGDDINIRDGRYGKSPLRYACVRGHLDSVSQLLESNAEVEDDMLPDALFGLPRVPSSPEQDKPRLEILRMLLNTGRVNLNARFGEQGKTILIFAVQRRRIELVRTLLEYEAVDVNFQDAQGNTALFYAIKWGKGREGKCLEMAHLLLQHGANPNTPDTRGYSPLILAADLGLKSIVDALLSSGLVQLQSPISLMQNDPHGGPTNASHLSHLDMSNCEGYTMSPMQNGEMTPPLSSSQSMSSHTPEIKTPLLPATPDHHPHIHHQIPMKPEEKVTSLDPEHPTSCPQTPHTQDPPALVFAGTGLLDPIKDAITVKQSGIKRCGVHSTRRPKPVVPGDRPRLRKGLRGTTSQISQYSKQKRYQAYRNSVRKRGS